MDPIRVLVADDHNLVRAGLRSLLDQIENVQVIAEAEDGNQAVLLTAQHRPDIVLMDIAMPNVNGMAATAQITKQDPAARVIILSMHSNKEYVLQSLSAGAKGYLLKGARVAELELALTAVMRGETYLSPAVSHHVVNAAQQPSKPQKLTPRQTEVLKLIVQGENRKTIAAKLQISPKTVDAFRAQIMQELDVHDLASLIRYAIKMGLVEEK
jgi:DNA-binding NarL/FixJ family response regulator